MVTVSYINALRHLASPQWCRKKRQHWYVYHFPRTSINCKGGFQDLASKKASVLADRALLSIPAKEDLTLHVHLAESGLARPCHHNDNFMPTLINCKRTNKQDHKHDRSTLRFMARSRTSTDWLKRRPLSHASRCAATDLETRYVLPASLPHNQHHSAAMLCITSGSFTQRT